MFSSAVRGIMAQPSNWIPVRVPPAIPRQRCISNQADLPTYLMPYQYEAARP
ncbi:hypothetical protein MGYG_00476 [Nannizzia gypsea CBS 118893]|uniref:Uncharacterized protein n=1 Tax=Arthroderma gypseum (strain ATCC MYA-4604 / CBS 118893) TaxID=535722 RepID=E5QZX2_ARTGP|nr:hypothetical protein MGYG_00476 [Nannizzia gypsea CBS 118893]EFQ97435.1 hypothetical protein MGYG_00476 [Nannizzia gypsea CBS 118893]